MTEDWRYEASCSEADPDLFSYPHGKGIAYRAILEQAAVDYCLTCPVKLECLQDATDDDLLHTTRGGVVPGVVYAKKVIDPAKPRKKKAYVSQRKEPLKTVDDYGFSEEELAYLNKFLARDACQNGHPITGFRDSYPGRKKTPAGKQWRFSCRVCHNATSKAYDRRSRNAGRLVA